MPTASDTVPTAGFNAFISLLKSGVTSKSSVSVAVNISAFVPSPPANCTSLTGSPLIADSPIPEALFITSSYITVIVIVSPALYFPNARLARPTCLGAFVSNTL